MIELIALLVVFGTAIWVAVDASRLGAKKGTLGGGMLDMGPASWFFCCLLLWIVAFPCYLAARPRLAARQALVSGSAGGPQAPWVPMAAAQGAAPGTWAPAVAPTATPVSVAAELQRLHELHQAGALSDQEFQALKAQVLAGTPAP